jgi:addiction module HigA family antidote
MPRIRTRPGEILVEEFLKPLDITPHALAMALRVPPSRIAGILNEKNPRAITADTALRLGRFFGTTAQFWLNLQSSYDLSLAEAQLRKQIEQDVRPYAA